MLLTFGELIGRLHPAVVHLPVGILVLAFVLQFISGLRHAIKTVLFIGAASAWLACISGYVLSKHDDYDPSMVSWHQWMGITTAVISTTSYFIYKKFPWPTMISLFILISITGHLGGNLTHGEGYLTGSSEEAKPIANLETAPAYDALIQPVLQQKCYSCHNANKRKGGLRMDQPDLLMKGGKNGIVIGKTAEESELIKRLLLPREDEHHMPPKEKPQLTENETALLHWWISAGASFTKKVKELPALPGLQQPTEKTLPDIPEEEISAANASDIQKLKDQGVVVLPVARNSNYLMANFVSAKQINIELLSSIKKQLVWLKMSGAKINDSALTTIGKCTNLTRLQLDNTRISNLTPLKNLQQLRYLNLVGTLVTTQNVLDLRGLKQLRSLYLYQTAARDANALKQAFPNTQIDLGGYNVPVLQTDTSRLKYEPKRP